MKHDAVLADRRQSVRDAAREWFRAGWIHEDAFSKVEAMYPDDRVRTGIAFRILFFVLTLAAIGGLLGTIHSQIFRNEKMVAVVAIAAGLLCWAITSYLTGPARRREGGIEAAFSVAAIANLIIGLAILLLEFHWQDRSTAILILFAVALISGLAAWSWGYWAYMAASAAFLFFAVMALPFGRLLWIIAFILAFRKLVVGSESGQLPPSLRKCIAALLSVAVLALYAAINVFLLDQHSLNWFRQPEFFPRWLAVILTATLPIVILWVGIARRRYIFLVTGFGLVLCSLATIRAYIHVAPLWVVSTASGCLLFVFAVVLRRYLESGGAGERAGFTAAPLTGQPGKHRAAEILASVAILTPDASAEPNKPGFEGGGGEFGGGGASGRF